MVPEATDPMETAFPQLHMKKENPSVEQIKAPSVGQLASAGCGTGTARTEAASKAVSSR